MNCKRLNLWLPSGWFVAFALVLFMAPHQVNAIGLVDHPTSIAACEPVGANTPAASPIARAESDLTYLDALIAYEAHAIQMASSALQRAQDSQVLRIALRVVESHAGELQLLKAWRAQWYPDAPPVSIASETVTASAGMCSTGNFDIDFLTRMIADRKAGIELADVTATQAQREELRDFALSLTRNWEAEISSMQSILDRLESSTELSTPVAG